MGAKIIVEHLKAREEEAQKDQLNKSFGNEGDLLNDEQEKMQQTQDFIREGVDKWREDIEVRMAAWTLKGCEQSTDKMAHVKELTYESSKNKPVCKCIH